MSRTPTRTPTRTRTDASPASATGGSSASAPTASVYIRPAAYAKLSTRARRVLAAVELANEADASSWYADLARVRGATGYHNEDALAGLLELRDRKVLDLILIAADARWVALVAPWKHRARLASEGAFLMQARRACA
jgi:hypothetical protein